MDKRNRGITLIALVITIIVLLILVGIGISMLTGDNGVLRQTSESKRVSGIAEAKERAQLDIIDWQTDQIKEKGKVILNDRVVKSILTGKDYVKTVGDISFIAQNGGYEIFYSDLYKGNSSEEQGTGISVNVPIPEGSTIIESDANKGIVIKDKNNNEWVWIEVPKSVTDNSTTDSEIETALQTYATDYRKSGWIDTWYNGCGLTETEYNTNKSKMLQSIKANGGFWIGRYEVGTDTVRTRSSASLTTPLIQQDKYPYNYVDFRQAQGLATQLNPDSHNYTSSLLYGIQWDLVCKYIEIKNEKTQEQIQTNSKTWGNYSSATFDITRGKYSTDNGLTYSNVIGTYTKTVSSNGILLTTGASERNKVLNIYDLAGNVYEFTLEKNSNSMGPCANRGGDYGGNVPVTYRNSDITTYSMEYIGFRPTLY